MKSRIIEVKKKKVERTGKELDSPSGIEYRGGIEASQDKKDTDYDGIL